jgi:hypothetical protein
MSIVSVRKKNRARLLLREDAGDGFHRRPPGRGIFRARIRIDSLQSAPARHHQAKAERRAGILQFAPPRRLPGAVAAQRHADVDDVPPRLAQQPQRQPAGDAFIVRMRRKNQGVRHAGRNFGTRAARNLPGLQGLSLLWPVFEIGKQIGARSHSRWPLSFTSANDPNPIWRKMGVHQSFSG